MMDKDKKETWTADQWKESGVETAMVSEHAIN